jgi:predicted transcriptional regulator
VDDVIIQIDTLVVELDAPGIAAVSAGRLQALGEAVVAALREHPGARAYVAADVVVSTSRPV